MSDPYDAAEIDTDDADDRGFGFEGYAPSKEVCILLIDASKAMCNTKAKTEEGEEEASSLQYSINAAHHYLKHSIISSPSDEIAVVFYNTRESKNASAFENVYTFQDLEAPSAAGIRALQQLAEGNSFETKIGSASGVDTATGLKFALWAASHMFIAKSSKTTSKRIVVFTVDEDPTAGVPEAQTYRDILHARCAELGTAGVTISPLLLLPHLRLDAFWKGMLEASGDEETHRAPRHPLENDAGLGLSDTIRKVLHRRRALSSLRWTVAPGLDIGLQLHSLVQPATKGATTLVRATDLEPVRSDTAYICSDTGAILRPDVDIHKYRFQAAKGSFPEVLLLNTERRALKASLPPGLQLLGFKPLSALQPFHQYTHSYYLRPNDKELQGSSTLYWALLGAMAVEGTMALCSFVRNKASEPRLVALLPRMEDDGTVPAAPVGLHMVLLPFADDLRAPETEPDLADKAAPAIATDEQVEAGLKLVKALTLGEDHPSELPNPALQRHFQILEAYALRDEPEPREEFEDETAPNPEDYQSAKVRDRLASFMQATGLDQANAAAGSKKRSRPLTEGVDASGAANVRQLAEAGKLDTLRLQDLKEFLQRIPGQKVSGKKADLVQRIMTHFGLGD